MSLNHVLGSAREAKRLGKYRKALQCIDVEWEYIPFYMRNKHNNEFLLERADCYWHLKDYSTCLSILSEVHSNRLPILCGCPHIHKKIYDTWMSRGKKLLYTQPSFAKLFFEWSLLHATTIHDHWHCLLLNGVATCLSGDHFQGRNLILKAKWDAYFIGYDMEEAISYWKAKGINALEEGRLMDSKHFLQTALILVDNGTNDESRDKLRHSIESCQVSVHFKFNEYQEALKLGKKLYAAEPVLSYKEAMRWQEFGQILLCKGRTDLVPQCLTLALDYAPQVNKRLRFNLLCQRSQIHHKTFNPKEALKDAENAISILPDDVEGYKCLVACYKTLDDSKTLSALNQCLRTEYNSHTKLRFLKDAISMAVKLEEATTTITTKVPKKLIKQLQEEAIQSRDWEILRVLYLGGGGPHKFQVGEGGLATGLRAEEVATEDAVAANFSKKPETLAALLTHGAPVDGLTDGANPLMHAVSNGDLEIVKVLLDYGANLCVQYENGLPVVHDVVQNAIGTGNFQMIQVLLDSGHSDIENIQDSEGNTVYHLSTRGKITNNKCKVIRLFLNANVDPTIPNKQERRPIDYLKKNDDRRRMLERFLRERNKAAEASCLLFPVGKLKVEGNRPYRTNLCQITRSVATMQGKCLLEKDQESKLQQTSATKADLRNYLEKLIESVTVVEDDIDESDDSEEEEEQEKEEEIGESNYDDVENEEVAYFKVPDNGESVNVKSTEDKTLETNDSTGKDVDDIEIENLEWEVDFSGKFLKSFRNKKMQPEMRRKIIEKIRMLAQGRWSKKLCKKLEGEPKRKEILLYESKLTKSARILWEKTIAFSQRNSSDPKLMLEPGGQGVLYSDIIRVWEVVLDHGNLEREIQNVVRSIVKSHERGSRCIIRKNLKGIGNGMPSKRKSGLSLPSSYQEISGSSNFVEREKLCYPPASSEENEFNILKFHPFTSAIIESLLDRNDVKSDISFPFKVTELEHAIINLKPDPPCPIILLGRSGTGKTICCLYRLWNEFQNYWEKAITAGPLMPRYAIPATTSGKQESSENCQASSSVSSNEKDAAAKPMEQSLQVHHEHFHQLFITKNHVLCSEAKKNFKDLKYSCSATKSMTMMCKDSLPNRIQDVGDTSWPLFIGARDWLRLLDASLLGETFFKRAEDGSLLERIVGWGEDDTHLISIPDKDEDEDEDDENDDDDDDEDDDTKGHRDEDNEDYGDDNDGEGENPTARKDHRGRTKAKKVKNVPKEVTYEVFRDELWPNMKKRKKVEYHPSLVWTEIKSFIKGSVEAMKTNSGFLSFKEYQELGRKRSTNLMEDRGTLYEMFETYERLRTSKGMFDEADLVYQLHRRLSDNPDLQWSIHSVYVDETQDFTQAELSLLIRCCRFQNRMFFTGDTAQSIVRGIAFRFEDLKALFHDIMSLGEAKSVEPVRTPDRLYQLTYNYRSHSGILKLASSVLNMLLYFFPESTDKLEEDRGLFDGPKPVLLESCSSSDMARILQGSKRRTSRIEFGAHQAVLVVSEEARKNMPEELKHGLVLTIYEAKGLEFDDVLIYNFFTDSQAKKEWKIATSDIDLKYIETQYVSSTGIVEMKDGDHKFKTKGTHFEASKHNILISELKFLYTAVTRARVNVWFFDEDEDARGPMYEYFQRLGLVRTDVFESAVMLEFDLESLEEQGHSLLQDDKLIESEGKALVKTAADRWREQGMVYYNKGLWLVAQKCFSFAEDEDMTCKSRVQQTAQDALKQRHSPRKMKEMLRSAAIGFLELHMVEEAALCLHNARERLLLAKLNMKMEKFTDASKLFQSVGHYDEASKCMERLNNYSQAIEILCEAGLFAKAIEVFERYNSLREGKALQNKDIVPPTPNRSTKQLCFEAAEAYLNDGKRKEMDAVLKRFSSTDERISFLKRKLCFKEAAGALVENNRKQEAAQFLKLHGRFKEAMKYSDDDKFLAAFYLYEARSLNTRILFANYYHEDVVQHLESAIKYYRRCKDQNGKAEALLFLGCQKDDPRLISESGKIFKERLNVCGESDAVEEWLKRKSLTHCYCETAVKAIEELLYLIISLHKRHARLSAVQRTKIARCEEYFGLEHVCDTRKRSYHTNFCERFHQIAPRDWLQGERANVQIEVEVKKAHQAIALHIFAKAISLNQRVTSFFKSKLKLKTIDDSHLVTDLPFNEKFEILFNWVFLDGAITKFFNLLKQFVSSPVLFEAEKVLPQELELFLPCKLFAELLFPEAGCKVQLPTAEQIKKIKKHPAVKRRLIQYCNHQWKSSGTASSRVLRTMRLLSVEQVINEKGTAVKKR